MVETILKTELPLKLYKRGKVRDTYEYGDKLLMVSTDRLSAFDVVFNEGIPYKGIVLNELSLFWFEKLKQIVKNHVVSSKVPKGLPAYLKRRSMLVLRAKPFPIECVVRGYLAGSAWKEYSVRGSVCGIKLPRGLLNGSKLPNPIFTPATKAERGHDINIDEKKGAEIVGKENFERMREISIKLYKEAAEYALRKGMILADTKFEFGDYEGEIILIDEALTPDSSRYWPLSRYSPGKSQESFDKQYVRDYLESLGWNKQPPPPPLPEEVIKITSEKYIEAYERITGEKFKR